jgi:epsilon-lactone hydrolase
MTMAECSEEYAAVIAMMEASSFIDGNVSVEERRTEMEAMAAMPTPAGVTVEEAELGGVPALWVHPEVADATAVLMWLHGGAYCLGSTRTHQRPIAHLALALGIPAVLVDYRLAPEQPFPAALDDATAAYRELVAGGVAPERVALGGDSAGGGLAAATLLNLRDDGDALPGAAVLCSPWTDLTFSGESWRTRADIDPILDEERLREAVEWYLVDHPATDPLASPAFGDYEDLPPMFVSAGDRETLRDDAVMVAEAARAAGVDVTLEIMPDMVHVFHALVGICPEGDAAMARIATFLRARLAL